MTLEQRLAALKAENERLRAELEAIARLRNVASARPAIARAKRALAGHA